MSSLVILLIGGTVCFVGNCNSSKRNLTFVSGILFVLAGKCFFFFFVILKVIMSSKIIFNFKKENAKLSVTVSFFFESLSKHCCV